MFFIVSFVVGRMRNLRSGINEWRDSWQNIFSMPPLLLIQHGDIQRNKNSHETDTVCLTTMDNFALFYAEGKVKRRRATLTWMDFLFFLC